MQHVMTRTSRTIVVRGLLCAVLGLAALTGVSCTSWAEVERAYHQDRDLPYVSDRGEDTWQTPGETVARGAGDCEDKAIYLHHLLRERGIDSTVVFGIQDVRRPTVGHAWVECEVDGRVQVLDPTGRLLIAREDLAVWEYYPVRASARIRAKTAEYVARAGAGPINSDYAPSPPVQENDARARNDRKLIEILSAMGAGSRDVDRLFDKRPPDRTEPE